MFGVPRTNFQSNLLGERALFEKKKAPETAKIALNLTLEGLKGPQVQVGHKSCSALCGTPVQAILHQTKLTWLAGGVREGQNLAQMGLAFKPNAKLLAWEPSRGPLMGSRTP